MSDALADHVALLAVAQRWERLYNEKCVENARLRAAVDELAEVIRGQSDGGNDVYVNSIYERLAAGGIPEEPDA